MKIDRPRAQRTAGVVLASLLAVSLLLSPLAWGVQPILAQAGVQSGSKIVVVGADGATLYTAPQGDEISSLPLGTVLTAIGRTADTEWVAVRTDDGVEGWVRTTAIVAFGLNQLPVMGENGAAASGATAAPDAIQPTTQPAATLAIPAATATLEPSPTPLPTATPEPPTATPTTAPAATAAQSAAPATAQATPVTEADDESPASSVRNLVAVVGGTGADLYDMPDGMVVETLPRATTVTVVLRNEAADWVFVTTNDGAGGWTQAQALVAFGLERLPVLDVAADEAEAPPAVAAQADATAVVDQPAADQPADMAQTTATPAATPAATQNAAPSLGAGVPATVTITEQRLNIRSGPASDYRLIGKAQPGEVLTAVARTGDNAWVQVTRDDLENGAGWAAAQFLALDNLAALPVDDSFAATESGAASASTATPALPALPAPPATASASPAPSGAEDSASDNILLPTATPAPAVDTPASTPVSAANAASDAEAAQVMEMVGAGALAPAANISARPAGLAGKIVFQDGRNNIYVYDLASGNVRWLTNGFDPDVTRDGSRVTFVRGGGNVNGVWTINIDGSNERHIHGGGEIMRGPKWSPDGNWIVFSRNNTNWKCFDLEFFGCVSFFELQGKFPQVPPPILYRLFIRGADRLEFPNWIITRINPDGGDFRDINALDSAVSPDWNEAGIVYQAKPGLEITEDTPDGRTRSVQHDGWDWDPDWQPGGGRIVYQSKEGSHWEIWSITPDGGGVFALTRPETTLVDELPSNVAPAFSPDGQHIVYISNRDENEDAGPWRLWVMDNGGGNKRPLPIDITVDYGFSSDQVASWSQ